MKRMATLKERQKRLDARLIRAQNADGIHAWGWLPPGGRFCVLYAGTARGPKDEASIPIKAGDTLSLRGGHLLVNGKRPAKTEGA